MSTFLVYFGVTNPKTEPYYQGTDQEVLDLAREFGLNSYADNLVDSLNQYYKEVINETE
jgi:hypothetical protein